MKISAFTTIDPNGLLSSTEPQREITSLCFDSRQASMGCAFFCFLGTQTDGEKFIAQAVEKGAILIITNNKDIEKIKNVSYFISTIPTRTLYSKASSFFFNHPDKKIKLIGITGTDGKTSTSYFTYQLFKLMGHKTGLLNTVNISDGEILEDNNYHQSTPESFYVHQVLDKAVTKGCEYFVLEATSHALSDEYNRLDGIKYKISAYTNISSEHLEFHKTYDRYIEAKCNLAKRTDEKVLFYDNNKECERIKVSSGNKATVLQCPAILEQSLTELSFIYDGELYKLPFGQKYNLENAFEAANIVSLCLGVQLKEVLNKLRSLHPVKGRFTLVPNRIGRTIIIDFAHTPKAYQAIMENLIKFKGNSSFIAVFGSSGKRDSSKRPEMGKVLASYCEKLIITEDDNRGEDLHTIFEELTSSIPTFLKDRVTIKEIDKREDAIKEALSTSSVDDFILLLGLGAQKGMDKGSYIKEWDEEEKVKSIINELSCICAK